MASRKLVRDFLFTKQPIFRQLLSTQLEGPPRLRLIHPNSFTATRQLNVFKQFSEKLKGEASNSEFRKNVKELKEKAGGVSEELKVRTKQTAEQLYKSVDGVWTEAEATAKKVSANVKEKLSAAKEEVKGSFGAGKQEPSSSSGDSVESSAGAQDGSGAASGEGNQQAGAGSETIFDKFKYGFSAATPKVSSAYEKVKEAKVVDLAKKVLDAVKDELSGKPVKRKRVHHTDPSTVETSNRTEIVIVPSKQPAWRKKWEEYKEKMQNHPMFKRVTKISEPVVSKGQELAEDLQERWETSDSPMVHKIQDLNEKVFGESAAALSFKEIRRRDPSFSLPDFVAEVQEVIKPVLLAFNKGDSEVLKKYCSPEMVERYKAEQKAYASQGVFFDNKILHISEANVTETKMMGDTPLILLLFQTQEVYCVRDRLGAITEGGKDTIHSVHYIWAMQQVEEGELGEDEGIYSTWRLRDMQRLGVQAYI